MLKKTDFLTLATSRLKPVAIVILPLFVNLPFLIGV